MKLLRIFQQAKDDESGAVTVDWVVLTSAIVVIGVGVVSTISPSLSSGAAKISSTISTAGN